MTLAVSRFTKLLLVIVAVAFGIRVAYVAIAKSGPCRITMPSGHVATSPSQCALGDQIFYNAEANSVASGRGFVEPLWAITHPGEKAPPAADHPPLTVFVLTPVAWLTDHAPLSWFIHESLHDHVREDRYTMVLLGTLVVFLVGLLGRRVGGDAVGLLAAGIAAINPNIWVNDGLVMSETVTVLVVVCALLLAFALWDRPSRWRAVALGAVCGLAALSRAELVLFVVLLGVVVAGTTTGTRRERGLRTGCVLAASFVVVAPWVGYNLARFHDPTFISTNDGIALLGSNCEHVYWGTAIGLTSIDGPYDCLQNPPPPGDQSQVSTEYRKQAFQYMSDHLRRVPAVVAARIARAWSLYRPNDMVFFNQGEGREKWVTRLGLDVYYPELLLAIVGGVVLVRRKMGRGLYVLCVPAIAATIGVAATYGQTRFRAAAEPSLAVLAAVGAVAIVARLTRRADTTTPSTDPAAVSV